MSPQKQKHFPVEEIEDKRYVQLLFEFENKNGKYFRYIKRVKRSFLRFFYDNIWNSSEYDILLFDLVLYKKEGNNLDDALYFFRQKKCYENNLVLWSSFGSMFRYISKYIILFRMVFILYGNDIHKNPQFKIYPIFKVYKWFDNLYYKYYYWKKKRKSKNIS